MGVPIVQYLIQRQGQLIQDLKVSTFKRQGAQLLPPGFNQVQPASVLGDERQLSLGGLKLPFSLAKKQPDKTDQVQ